ncbi:cell division protein FtsQ/DivIB [Sphingomonas hankyongi]|uniref:Cell division protein FtsQ n=1 Tax=Sphingomonas hankyongi TaxID=2908209 RepID=A0ABT0S049_9SPHN|nr:cell division protein FtsQ/DivIB [Sphingomonas hankyongi]MCL6728930.1 cell division protein FtsQ/DivIB [Sphingomonas hankyongi]
MSASHVRRGGGARNKTRKPAKVTVPKNIAKKLPVDQARANKLAGLTFAAFMLAIGVVVLVALDVPAKAERSAAAAVGRAGFIVNGYQIVGINRMDRRLVDEVVTDELRRAAETTGKSKAPQPLVNVSAIRDRLLQFGWVSDARVSRRLPDTLVIDIVERTPAALWQNQGQLALIDGEGVVLDRVPISKMPDLPLLIGPGANAHSQELDQLMAGVPTLKPQLASATWVGRRRWDLNFQSGETIALPEGNQAAGAALQKFAKMDRSTGLLGRGILRFDLRIPGKMIARLPRAPGEPISGEDAANKG